MLSILKSLLEKLEISNFLNRNYSPTTKAVTKVKAGRIDSVQINNHVTPAGYKKKSLLGLPQAIGDELQQSTIYKKVVYLHDMADSNETPQIQDRTFVDCEVRGPSIIIPNESEFNECGFDGDKEMLFIPIHGDRYVLGAIGVNRCKFNGCTFVGVGMLVPQNELSKYL